MTSTPQQHPPRRAMNMVVQHPLLFDFVHGSAVDGPGLRSVVFLKGCPLSCAWCHNPESQNAETETLITPGAGSIRISDRIGEIVSPEQIAADILRDLPFYEASGGGVTFSGGEPMMYMPFLQAVGERIKNYGVHIAVDTSGYFDFSEYVHLLQGTVDLFLYDLKLMDAEQHHVATGVDNALILENLVLLRETGVDIHIRIPLIPGHTATEENLSQIASFVCENDLTTVALLPYNPSGIDKCRKLGRCSPVQLPSTPMSLREHERWQAFFDSCLSNGPLNAP